MTDPRITRTRSAVVEAAAKLLLDVGPAAVTIEAVVQLSGVARSTIYRHFPTSTDVLRAAVDALIPHAEEDRAVLQVPLTEEVLREALTAGLWSLESSLREEASSRVLPSLLDLIQRDPSLEEHRRDLVGYHRGPLTSLLRQGQQAGLLDHDADVDLLVDQLVGPLYYRHLISGAEVEKGTCVDLVDGILRAARS